MFVVLSGHVAITQRDGLGHVTPVVEQGPGQFLAEVGQLSGRPALVDGHAEGDVEALLIPPERLRALLVAEAELGERIMRALILRRVSLIQERRRRSRADRRADSPTWSACRTSSAATAIPHTCSTRPPTPEARRPHRALRAGAARSAARGLPGRHGAAQPERGRAGARARHARPTARTTRLRRRRRRRRAGGARDRRLCRLRGALGGRARCRAPFGGQAGASARIENYLGFPTGISGQALTGRAFVQAQKFGAEMLIPAEVESLDCSRSDGAFGLELADGGDGARRAPSWSRAARATAGRRSPNLAAFEGRGVWYWASPIEASSARGEEVIAGRRRQLGGPGRGVPAAHARKVRMMVRGPGLAASMSRYLIDRIAATPNIELMTADRDRRARRLAGAG